MIADVFVGCYCIFATYYADCVDNSSFCSIISIKNAYDNCKNNIKSGEKLCKEILLVI